MTLVIRKTQTQEELVEREETLKELWQETIIHIPHARHSVSSCDQCTTSIVANDPYRGERVCEVCGLVAKLPIMVVEAAYEEQDLPGVWYGGNGTIPDYSLIDEDDTDDSDDDTDKRQNSNDRLKEAIRRLNATNPSKKIPKKIWRLHRQKDYVKVVKTITGCNNTQMKDIIHIIEKHGVRKFHTGQCGYEDIIPCMVVWRMSKDQPRHPIGVINKLRSLGLYNKTLYQSMKPKLEALNYL